MDGAPFAQGWPNKLQDVRHNGLHHESTDARVLPEENKGPIPYGNTHRGVKEGNGGLTDVQF
jgi:hypothetical protein